MNVRVWSLTLLAAGFLCGGALAGNPPAGSADARNVSGLETGDAGQSLTPPPGAGAATDPAFQVNGGAPGWPGVPAIGAAALVLSLFFIFGVHVRSPAVGRGDDQR